MNRVTKSARRDAPGLVLQLCHGHMHDVQSGPKWPAYMNKRYARAEKLDLSRVIRVDVNPMAFPDVVADLTKQVDTDAIPVRPGSVSLILSMYCMSHVYGTWRRPNNVFFRAAAKWLRPGGRLVVAMPLQGLDMPIPYDRLDKLNRGFMSRLPKQMRKGHAWPLVEAFDHAKADARKTARVRNLALRMLSPEAATAVGWLEAAARKMPKDDESAENHASETVKTRMAAFAASVSRITHGALSVDNDRAILSIQEAGNPLYVVFVRAP